MSAKRVTSAPLQLTDERLKTLKLRAAQLAAFGRVKAPSRGIYYMQPFEPLYEIYEQICKDEPALRPELEAAVVRRKEETKTRLRARGA